MIFKYQKILRQVIVTTVIEVASGIQITNKVALQSQQDQRKEKEKEKYDDKIEQLAQKHVRTIKYYEMYKSNCNEYVFANIQCQ